MQTQSQPLTGVKVIDLTTYGAGPTVGRVLGDWGADVIKVETLAGDPARYTSGNLGWPIEHGTSISAEHINANKRCISVDLKTQAGQEIMDRLLRQADIFISSNRLQALEKNSLDYETLSRKYPRLIWTHINGFGEVGPMCNDPGFDTVCYWARTGQMIDFAEKDTSPLTTPIAIADHLAGPIVAGGISAALYRQARTGKGEKVTFSLLGLGIWNLSSMFLATQAGQIQYPKTRTKTTPLANSYKCADGEWFLMTAFEWNRYFPLICKIIGRPELVSDARFVSADAAFENSTALIEIIGTWCARYPIAEVMELFKENDIPCSQLMHIKDIIHDQQAIQNSFIMEVDTRFHGKWWVSNPPVQFGGAYPPVYRPAPLLGGNTDEVLKEIGYSDGEITKLHAEAAVK